MRYIQAIAGALTGAPWYAYVFLIYVLYIGIKATKTQTVWLPKIFIILVIISGLFLFRLIVHYGLRPASLAIYLGATLLGSILGWLLVSDIQLKVDRDKKLITLPGTYSTLILFTSIFVVRYFWGYMDAVHSSMVQTSGY